MDLTLVPPGEEPVEEERLVRLICGCTRHTFLMSLWLMLSSATEHTPLRWERCEARQTWCVSFRRDSSDWPRLLLQWFNRKSRFGLRCRADLCETDRDSHRSRAGTDGRLTSLLRQLKYFGFRSVPPAGGSGHLLRYTHPNFQRGQPQLLAGMRRSTESDVTYAERRRALGKALDRHYGATMPTVDHPVHRRPPDEVWLEEGARLDGGAPPGM